jgi:hypothetical protein
MSEGHKTKVRRVSCVPTLIHGEQQHGLLHIPEKRNQYRKRMLTVLTCGVNLFQVEPYFVEMWCHIMRIEDQEKA